MSFDEHTGYLSGRWLPKSQISIGIDDLGFRQGVTVVERMRTYGGRIFSIREHLQRWEHSLRTVGIDNVPPPATVATLLDQLLQKNDHQIDQLGDVGITLFATPGNGVTPVSCGQADPTLGLHLNRLDFDRIRRRRDQGQPLVVAAVRQPDAECWPRSVKVRSRLHYFLADRQAKQLDPEACGVLVDADGSLTETSIANIAVVLDASIVSPPRDRVLKGITQQVIERLARQSEIPWTTSPINAAQLAEADEVLLMGTDGGIWYSQRVDDRVVGDGQPGPVYRELRSRFDRLVEAFRSGDD